MIVTSRLFGLLGVSACEMCGANRHQVSVSETGLYATLARVSRIEIERWCSLTRRWMQVHKGVVPWFASGHLESVTMMQVRVYSSGQVADGPLETCSIHTGIMHRGDPRPGWRNADPSIPERKNERENKIQTLSFLGHYQSARRTLPR